MAFGKKWLRKIRSRVAQILYNKKAKENAILPSNPQRILIIGWEYKIGDYIVSAFFFRELKRIFPGVEIILLASGSHNLPSYHNSIDRVIYCNRRNMLQFFAVKKKVKSIGAVDICIAITTFSPQEVPIISVANPQYTYAIAAEEREQFNIYDYCIPRKGHHSQFFMTVLEKFKLGKKVVFCDKYAIEVPNKYIIPFKALIRGIDPKKIVVINPFGSCRHFSFEVLMEIIEVLKERLPQHKIVILAPLDTYEKLLAYDLGENILIPHYITGIEHSLAIIKNCELLISPDTFAVHAASNYGISQIAVYYSSSAAFDVWHPNSDKAQVTFVQNNVNNVDIEELESMITEYAKLASIAIEKSIE